MTATVPILDRIEAYRDDLSQVVVPESAPGKAVTYARTRRAVLRRYARDCRLTIDNDVSGWMLRLQAFGRKDWDFLGVRRPADGQRCCSRSWRGEAASPGDVEVSS